MSLAEVFIGVEGDAHQRLFLFLDSKVKYRYSLMHDFITKKRKATTVFRIGRDSCIDLLVRIHFGVICFCHIFSHKVLFSLAGRIAVVAQAEKKPDVDYGDDWYVAIVRNCQRLSTLNEECIICIFFHPAHCTCEIIFQAWV